MTYPFGDVFAQIREVCAMRAHVYDARFDVYKSADRQGVVFSVRVGPIDCTRLIAPPTVDGVRATSVNAIQAAQHIDECRGAIRDLVDQ